MLNHASAPNARVDCELDGLQASWVLRAACDLMAGEEVLISYVNTPLTIIFQFSLSAKIDEKELKKLRNQSKSDPSPCSNA
jgi:hypothetical protein